MESERKNPNLEVVGSIPAEAFQFGNWDFRMRISIQNPKSKIQNRSGGVAQLESAHFSTKEKVEGSSPSVPISPKADNHSIYLISHIFRGRLIERTLDFESGNKGLNPFPEANFL